MEGEKKMIYIYIYFFFSSREMTGNVSLQSTAAHPLQKFQALKAHTVKDYFNIVSFYASLPHNAILS